MPAGMGHAPGLGSSLAFAGAALAAGTLATAAASVATLPCSSSSSSAKALLLSTLAIAARLSAAPSISFSSLKSDITQTQWPLNAQDCTVARRQSQFCHGSGAAIA